MAMWVGALEFDLLLGDVHSLKEKRSVVRPLIADVRKRFELSVAEVDHLQLHRRTGIGVAAVSADRAHLVDVLNAVEQAGRLPSRARAAVGTPHASIWG